MVTTTAAPEKECAELALELERVREALVSAEESLHSFPHGPHPDQALSARNLVHYLALRERDIRPLQRRLMRQGLSSLGRTESHVLASVEAVARAARALSGQTPSEAWTRDEPERIAAGQATLAANTDALLGPSSTGRRVRIMVTASREAADDPTLIGDLVASGMDALRLNCAHDDEEIWRRTIRRFREAGPGRRVLMDLAGPKIRTGALGPGPRVMKIRPQRDSFGGVVSGGTVRLGPGDHAAGGVPTIPVDAEWADALLVGDCVDFEDTRRKVRSFVVDSKCNGGVLAHCFATAYIVPGTRLRNSRTGSVASVGDLQPTEGAISLWKGDRLTVTRSLRPGGPAGPQGPAWIGCTLREAFGAVRPGERVWFDDGKIGGVIESARDDSFLVRLTHAPDRGERPARLRPDKGINFPDTALPVTTLTQKDESDLRFVAAHADLVGLSFVQTPEQVREVRDLLERHGAPHVGVVLKIETRRAFENLPALLLEAMRGRLCGVMIARGDLAVEVGYERLAEVQEEILWMCEAAHAPVIWATQVLENLAKRGLPSRAEISDAAMGERAECVMLNKGPFVREALKALNDILTRMETHQYKKSAVLRPLSVAGAFLRGRRSG